MNEHYITRHGGNILDISAQDTIPLDTILDLSTNAFSLAEPITKNIVDATPYDFAHYPSSYNKNLYSAVANLEHVEEDSLIFGNGSSELIYLIFGVIRPERVLLIGPLFNEYATICEAYNIPYTVYTISEEIGFVPSNEDIQKIRSFHPTVTVVCTPNNPTGAVYPIAFLIHSISSAWILIDVAYKEFLYGTSEYEELYWGRLQNILRSGVHLITLHSCTKFFASAGIRLGYMIVKKEQRSLFTKFLPPWNVTSFAQNVYTRCIENIESYRAILPLLETGTEELITVLQRYRIFTEVYSTLSMGFVLCAVHSDISAHSLTAFLRSNRILIRCCDTITGMPNNMVRLRYVPDSLDELSNTLDAFIGSL